MQIFLFTLLAFATAASLRRQVNNTSPVLSSFSPAQIENGSALLTVDKIAAHRIKKNLSGRWNQTCTFNSSFVRHEFRAMPKKSRKAFTNAIICLQNTKPKYMSTNDSSRYPGVKSRYDEYVATHINYTMSIHMTANFFAWHRYFVFQLEQDLQTYCNYSRGMPYWNWAIDAMDPASSVLFNGDTWSMGSNGAYIGNRSYTYLGLQNVNFPPGSGGGCVTNGPFSNYTVRMGPIDSPYGGNVNSSFQHNPRCLVRDINPWFSRQYMTYTNVTTLLLNSSTIQDFQATLQGYGSTSNTFGVHSGGHWMIGGPSVMADFHSSPSDPLFFLHHAMIDKMWMTWQYLDIWDRQNLISGTSTLNNDPPSPEMSLDDILPFGLVAPDQRFGHLMDSFAGPFCYRYA